MIALQQTFLDKTWSLLKVDQDHLSHVIQEEIEILMHLALLTRTYKFGMNSYGEKSNVTSVLQQTLSVENSCAI